MLFYHFYRFLCGLTFFVFVILQCGNLHGSVRGIPVKVLTKTGEEKEITLYSAYYALIVGCGEYKYWPKLSNPPKDAMQVGRTLRYLGFKVKVLLNPSSFQLKKALNELVATIGKKRDIGILFYFAGHGHTITEANGKPLGYIVPVDVPDPDRDLAGFIDKAISMRKIEEYTKLIQSKHVIMLFDSCFSGALFTLTRALPSRYIREKVNLPVREFITAGRENETVPDQSIFKQCFLIGIGDGDADLNEDGYITGEELGTYLQEHVVNYTSGSQHPQFGKIRDPLLDRGDFVFVPKGSVKQTTPGEESTSTTFSKSKKPETPKLLSSFHRTEELAKSSELKEGGSSVLVVETTPAGARIYFDNKLLGKSPLTVEGLSPGEGIIRIELDGYETRIKRLWFKENSTEKLYVILKPVKAVTNNKEMQSPEIPSGTLTVETSPEDARVRILNIRPRYHDNIRLRPGKYLIEISKSGYTTVKRWIKLKSMEDKSVYIILSKAPSKEPNTVQNITTSKSKTSDLKGWVGLVVNDIDPKLTDFFSKYLGIKNGVFVTRVEPNGPAQSAGIMRGDIIMEFNGIKVTNALSLSKQITASQPGTNATMLIRRKGKKMLIKIRIGIKYEK